MKKAEIIQTLKNSYPRDTRKQVVKTILTEEKNRNIPNYKIINQIFSYVLSELGWDMVKDTNDWDNVPLVIMKDTFPEIEKTRWYNDKILTAKKTIGTDIRYDKDTI